MSDLPTAAPADDSLQSVIRHRVVRPDASGKSRLYYVTCRHLEAGMAHGEEHWQPAEVVVQRVEQLLWVWVEIEPEEEAVKS